MQILSGIGVVLVFSSIWARPAEAASEVVLHHFTASFRGSHPYAGVIRDSAGNLYGTTYDGGASNVGVVYKIDTTGHVTGLYSFTGGTDGGHPYAGVIGDSAGNLYGTTEGGGAANIKVGHGVVYKLDSSGQKTVLYSFTGGTDGAYPVAGVIRDSAGNLYGTTKSGGISDYGVVYKIDTTGQETVLYSFTGGADGGKPYGGLFRDSVGNLYGTTEYGGISDYGVVYKIDTTGQETVLYSFTGGADGGEPIAGVIRDSAGNLYGTTEYGGTANVGVVYKSIPPARRRCCTLLPVRAASYPVAGVIRDSAGNLYGTAATGGTLGYGVVYKIDTTGQETVLYSFTSGKDGTQPDSGVIGDFAGNLYGTTSKGGVANLGVVYRIDSTGQETLLHSFTGEPDGADPVGVIRDSAGNLYVTTNGGGASNIGAVYKIDSTGQETVLYSFGSRAEDADGEYPNSG